MSIVNQAILNFLVIEPDCVLNNSEKCGVIRKTFVCIHALNMKQIELTSKFVWALIATVVFSAITVPSVVAQSTSSPPIRANSVTSGSIKDGEVKTQDLADNAVTTPKIADNA